MIMGVLALMRLGVTAHSIRKRNAYADRQTAVHILVNVLRFAYQQTSMVPANMVQARRFEISLICSFFVTADHIFIFVNDMFAYLPSMW